MTVDLLLFFILALAAVATALGMLFSRSAALEPTALCAAVL